MFMRIKEFEIHFFKSQTANNSLKNVKFTFQVCPISVGYSASLLYKGRVPKLKSAKVWSLTITRQICTKKWHNE